MNARLYDPALGRFLSPDPYVQSPDNSQNFNRYSYCLNNPLRYSDPSGKFIPIIVAAAIGAIINIGIQGYSGNINSIGGFFMAAGIGALSGAAGGFLGGLVGGAVGLSGFAGGAISGAAGGAASGFVGGTGNAWMNGANFGDALVSGLKGGLFGGLTGGLIGGIVGGVDAALNKANFIDGHAHLNLSEGYGAENIPENIKSSNVKGFYKGKFEGVRVYESKFLGTLEQSRNLGSGGITLPDIGIVVGEGVYSQMLDISLLKHEFGHVLQAREVGYSNFYYTIGEESLSSASRHGVNGWRHESFWTETWANYKSYSYFNTKYGITKWPGIRFPVRNISPEMYIKYFGVKLYLNNY